tara:strand:+ start:250 stop:702 length:453 start_codon:yes stop_codon:yes gene_type:complete
MALGQRRSISNELITQLKKIDGGVSTFDATYTYTMNLNTNVYRGIKFYDEVNDFPSMYMQASEDIRGYETGTLTEAEIVFALRYYVDSDVPKEDIDNLAQDIEHVLYNFSPDPSLDIMDITIDTISNDEGLLAPLGLGEIFFTVLYKLDR